MSAFMNKMVRPRKASRSPLSSANERSHCSTCSSILRVYLSVSLLLGACTAVPLLAQAPALTITQAVRQATEKYPSIRASLEQVSAAAAEVDLARISYLPRADMVTQLNRGTHNNLSGLLFPQSVISPVSGPVFPQDRLANAWGTAAGILVSWEPFDFGLRKANVGVAEASRLKSEQQIAVARLEVGTAAADAFLTILAAQQSVRAAQAGVDRARTIHQVVNALVQAKLRPGADASRMRAELALAEIQLIRAEQSVRIARAALAQFLGTPSSDLSIEPGPLLQSPPNPDIPAGSLDEHPAVQEQAAAEDEIKARESALERSYFPRFILQGTTYARGTGWKENGTAGGFGAGLGPNTLNWAFGITVTFPALEFKSLRAREEFEIHRERVQIGRRERVVRELQAQTEKARAALEGARRIAENAPVQLEAAQATEEQSRARYQAGLGTIIEVADAERLLTAAETDDSRARLNVWRAMLALASAEGNLSPFLQKTGK